MNKMNPHRPDDDRLLSERLASLRRSRKSHASYAVNEIRFRAQQARGKIRRLVDGHFHKDKVQADLELRRGECNRCGACCEILFRCPFLKKHVDGSSACGIYQFRPNSCRLFPINQKDIDDVKGNCSYYFVDELAAG